MKYDGRLSSFSFERYERMMYPCPRCHKTPRVYVIDRMPAQIGQDEAVIFCSECGRKESVIIGIDCELAFEDLFWRWTDYCIEYIYGQWKLYGRWKMRKWKQRKKRRRERR